MKNYLLAFAVLFLLSCEKDDPEIENEEELITTLTYTLTAPDGTKAIMTFRDLDGEGGNAPVITTQPLKLNTTYTGDITLLNESVQPAENITDEVNEEKEDHQFFISSTVPGVSVLYTDTDANSRPVGLKTSLTTTTAGTGKLKVTLRHNPNKAGMDVSSGNITNADGETDIQVEFDVTVK